MASIGTMGYQERDREREKEGERERQGYKGHKKIKLKAFDSKSLLELVGTE
jgi:hypothetical protein